MELFIKEAQYLCTVCCTILKQYVCTLFNGCYTTDSHYTLYSNETIIIITKLQKPYLTLLLVVCSFFLYHPLFVLYIIWSTLLYAHAMVLLLFQSFHFIHANGILSRECWCLIIMTAYRPILYLYRQTIPNLGRSQLEYYNGNPQKYYCKNRYFRSIQ